MRFLYRISNNSYKKKKLENASKENCFLNFCEMLLDKEDKLYVIADNVNDELAGFLEKNIPQNGHIFRVNTGSNAASFRLQLNLVNQIPKEEIVFLHEDDYLYREPFKLENHKKFCNQLILEGLQRADYVSLYDHPDKYWSPKAGGNPFITEGGVENTGIFLTEHSHWKYTNSTTCTFAVMAGKLLDDLSIWHKWSSGVHPYDFNAFIDLKKKGRTLATSIPGYSTHVEDGFLSPLANWSV